jgi:2-amino-4-hydroxy-6-hydroxymethyldihydropteridine diphosphokinase
MKDVAYIALGSNLGDRAAYLAFARDAIAALPHSRIIGESTVDETPPFGPAGQGAYLNQMLAVETELEPHTLLRALQDIESRAGRVRAERWGARTLDLDIVRFDSQSVSDATLTIPHPGLGDRDFWQRELEQLRGAS